ncbi:tetratricopeptide repeat protein 33 [Carica papaya]|uniref:tetratricopeptide repeat protein 33 n=1 Tax=Carica papaya TaxID=3649 RepID=UPI000B8D1739|nr:tetratricopeptide repeat protein 33 [Carica papaya]
MKVTWTKKTKKRSLGAISHYPSLPFDQESPDNNQQHQSDSELKTGDHHLPAHFDSRSKQLAESFQLQGNKFAEEGKYPEALGKWEAALNLIPENAKLQEQKAQVLLEIGDAWKALKAATRATELEPSWAEAWITLGRAQLNFGEPDSAIESFDRALAIKPDSEEAKDDRQTALHLVKRRKQLHASGLSNDRNRYAVGDNKTGGGS